VNTKVLNELAALICRAQEQDRTPMGIAFAIDAAGRHMSPETAAELTALRARVAELEAERHVTNEALDDAARALRASRDWIAELEQVIADAPASYVLMDRARAAASADGITQRIAPTQALREADPNGLHHSYRVGRDLPELGGAL
jgi:hypothetical protein